MEPTSFPSEALSFQTEPLSFQTEPLSFQTEPGRYKHWRVAYTDSTARIFMQVEQQSPLKPGYELKLNSYDLGVDIELADIVRRLRFEHPEVSTLVVSSGHQQVFCSGANIHMLGQSTHAWKVNFCKYTNETRCELESLSAHGDFRSLCAISGPCAGGGYELAMACDEILLVEDGNSAVSLPETPLLGVLPGTGGLTRLVDKRKVRRDRADVFCTVAEGIKGKRAVKWRLVDAVVPRSRFEETITARVQELSKAARAKTDRSTRRGIALRPLALEATREERRYSTLAIRHKPDERLAELTIIVPPVAGAPCSPAEIHTLGDQFWPLRMVRELEDALLDLRVNHPRTGLLLLRTRGALADALAWDDLLIAQQQDWLVQETIFLMGHVFRRMERSSCSLFALIDLGSCFGGSLLEAALTCDRLYMLDAEGVKIALNPLNHGLLPMASGIARSACRLLGEPELYAQQRGDREPKVAQAAEELGLITEALDEIDFEDSVRVAVEERVSLSPDALTGMEANLRFAGPETMETKIFGRLSAWQNWIFIRPNATGPHGALTLYGKPERPSFDFSRV